MTPKNQQPFADIPLEEHSVGHAGLYVPDESNTQEDKYKKVANTLGVISETITNDIPLGLDKGGKTLIDCETGIKAFVKDHLAGTKDNPVDNHLPNTETGVWIYYLTQGIERDFGRTWEATPKSLREKLGKEDKSIKSGGRPISKKEKNLLIAKRRWEYWEDLIEKGEITEEAAELGMKEAIERVKELKEKGLYISTKRTAGVMRFDWEKEIKEKWDGDETKLDIYKKHKILPLVPAIEHKEHMRTFNTFVKREWDKSILKLESGVSFDKDFMISKIEEWGKAKEHYKFKTFSICKIEKAGKMKERWFVVDALRKSDNKQVLLMWDTNGVDGMLE